MTDTTAVLLAPNEEPAVDAQPDSGDSLARFQLDMGSGSDIDVLRTGTWTDSNGQTVAFDEPFIDALVDNFVLGVAGQDIPIDLEHKFSQAVGWITGMRRAGDKLVETPNWNMNGRFLIDDKVYRYVSATINMTKQFIVSVSLTNFPAVKGLRPLQFNAQDVAQQDVPTFIAVRSPEDNMPNDTSVITGATQVEAQQPPPAQTPAAVLSDPTPTSTVDISALSESIRQSLLAELTGVFTNSLQQFKEGIVAQAQLSEHERNQIVMRTMAEIAEKQDISNFANHITNSGKHALAVKPDAVSGLLLSLPAANRKDVRDMLEAIHSAGTVDFSEVGTSAGKRSVRQLDKEMQAVLAAFVASGGTAQEFFSANADIVGDMSDYDAAQFPTEKGA